jgi:hypothetical protein
VRQNPYLEACSPRICRDYARIAHRKRAVVFRRISERKREEEIFTDINETVTLNSLGVEISLADVYENVAFEKE